MQGSDRRLPNHTQHWTCKSMHPGHQFRAFQLHTSAAGKMGLFPDQILAERVYDLSNGAQRPVYTPHSDFVLAAR